MTGHVVGEILGLRLKARGSRKEDKKIRENEFSPTVIKVFASFTILLGYPVTKLLFLNYSQSTDHRAPGPKPRPLAR